MPQLEFKYMSGPAYRNFYASGAYGGALPSGEIFLGFYTERHAFPTSCVLEVSDDGTSQGEKADIPPFIVREVEMGATINLNTAKALRDFLSTQIGYLEEHARKKQEEVK